jgi:hypothetical protein
MRPYSVFVLRNCLIVRASGLFVVGDWFLVEADIDRRNRRREVTARLRREHRGKQFNFGELRGVLGVWEGLRPSPTTSN